VVASSSLAFEAGPSQPVVLQWATYFDAADQAGQSRLWGGIHIEPDDFAGRRVGAQVGAAAMIKAEASSRGFSSRAARILKQRRRAAFPWAGEQID
jgi:hypothetical protein